MSAGLDIEAVEAALKKAAHKAIRGTSIERSGRFLPQAESAADQQPPNRSITPELNPAITSKKNG